MSLVVLEGEVYLFELSCICMSEFVNLLTEERQGILYLTINREEKMNAMNLDTLEELRQVFDEVMDNKAIKGVILTGAGEKAFVAGADIT